MRRVGRERFIYIEPVQNRFKTRSSLKSTTATRSHVAKRMALSRMGTNSRQYFCTGVRGKNDWLESVEFNGKRLRQTGKYAKSLLTKRLGKLFGIGTCNTKVFRSLFVLRKVVVVEQEEFIS